MMLTVMVCGFMLKLLMILFHRWININPYSLSEGWSVFYLLFCRPIYIIGTSLILMPIIVQNKSVKALRQFLSHPYWVPQSRLCYGVFLCNGMFMQYTIYDNEKGLWVQAFDAYLFFFAILTYSIFFSFLTYVFIEGPFSSLLKIFYKVKFGQSLE